MTTGYSLSKLAHRIKCGVFCSPERRNDLKTCPTCRGAGRYNAMEGYTLNDFTPVHPEIVDCSDCNTTGRVPNGVENGRITCSSCGYSRGWPGWGILAPRYPTHCRKC